MFLSTFNLGHALPLTFVRFSCCARPRAQQREQHAICVGNAAIAISSIANRFCESSRWEQHLCFAAQCCVRAARHAALGDSTVLLRL